MSVRSLRQRARELGVAEGILEAAAEGSKPKQDLIKLIDGASCAGSGLGAAPEDAIPAEELALAQQQQQQRLDGLEKQLSSGALQEPEPELDEVNDA